MLSGRHLISFNQRTKGEKKIFESNINYEEIIFEA